MATDGHETWRSASYKAVSAALENPYPTLWSEWSAARGGGAGLAELLPGLVYRHRRRSKLGTMASEWAGQPASRWGGVGWEKGKCHADGFLWRVFLRFVAISRDGTCWFDIATNQRPYFKRLNPALLLPLPHQIKQPANKPLTYKTLGQANHNTAMILAHSSWPFLAQATFP